MTDFITVETGGSSGNAFTSWWNATVPPTVPSGDRYILQITTQDLIEYPAMTAKTINGDIILRPAPAQAQTGIRVQDGGTGRRITRTSSIGLDVFTIDCLGSGRIIIEDLECLFAPPTNTSNRFLDLPITNAPLVIFQRCLLTNNNIGSDRLFRVSSSTVNLGLHVISCRIWDEATGVNARMIAVFANNTGAKQFIVQGNVIIGNPFTNQGITVELFGTEDAGTVADVQGNIVVDVVGGTNYAVAGTNSGPVFAQNLSGDATGQITGATVANELVSVANPDVKTGSLALQVWTNEPTTFGAEIDIRRFNRSAVALLADWDSGSMQFSTVALPASTASGNITRPVAFSNIFDITRNTAPDIVFS